ncbi:MAG TPA: hypothetical protein VGD65_09555, partial [Chryseosolibacter sp.]
VTSGFTQDNYYQPKYSTILDSSKGERLLRQCSRGTPRDISAYWTPTEKDVQKIEINFKKVIKLKSPNGQAISNLDKFAFQYIGVTIKTKKFIYLNAFHFNSVDEFNTFYKNWTTDPIVMCDGGDHYWGVLFDLNKLKFRDLEVNGII